MDRVVGNLILLLQIFLPPANEVCEGYVFTPVCHSVHRGGVTPVHARIHTPPGPEATSRDQRQTRQDQRQTPPRGPEADTSPGPEAYTPWKQCMLGDTGNKRAVRILLECIPVLHLIFQTPPSF